MLLLLRMTTSFVVTQPKVAFPTHRGTLENTSAASLTTFYSGVPSLTGTKLNSVPAGGRTDTIVIPLSPFG
jgi:hypothetical protein